MVTNKLYLDDRTDEYIILCKFGSQTISGHRVTGVEPLKPPSPPPVTGSPKKPGLNRVNIYFPQSVKVILVCKSLSICTKLFLFYFFVLFYFILFLTP